MGRYKIIPWILLILFIINVTLAAPVVLRETSHASIDVVDVREDAISLSRFKKRNDELEKLWDETPSAAHWHPRRSPAPPESDSYSDYESAPESPNSFRTATSEFQPASPETETPPSEESSVWSGSHRSDESSSERYLASDEGGPGSSKSYSFLSSPLFSPSPSPSHSPSPSEPDLPVNLEPEPGPVAVPQPNPSASGLPTTSSPAAESMSQKSFLGKLVTKSKFFLSKLASKSKNFFGKLAGKFKFWRRTSEDASA